MRDVANQPIPSYGQNEIKSFARVFTGWTYPPFDAAQRERPGRPPLLRQADGAGGGGPRHRPQDAAQGRHAACGTVGRRRTASRHPQRVHAPEHRPVLREAPGPATGHRQSVAGLHRTRGRGVQRQRQRRARRHEGRAARGPARCGSARRREDRPGLRDAEGARALHHVDAAPAGRAERRRRTGAGGQGDGPGRLLLADGLQLLPRRIPDSGHVAGGAAIRHPQHEHRAAPDELRLRHDLQRRLWPRRRRAECHRNARGPETVRRCRRRSGEARRDGQRSPVRRRHAARHQGGDPGRGRPRCRPTIRTSARAPRCSSRRRPSSSRWRDDQRIRPPPLPARHRRVFRGRAVPGAVGVGACDAGAGVRLSRAGVRLSVRRQRRQQHGRALRRLRELRRGSQRRDRRRDRPRRTRSHRAGGPAALRTASRSVVAGAAVRAGQAGRRRQCRRADGADHARGLPGRQVASAQPLFAQRPAVHMAGPGSRTGNAKRMGRPHRRRHRRRQSRRWPFRAWFRWPAMRSTRSARRRCRWRCRRTARWDWPATATATPAGSATTR